MKCFFNQVGNINGPYNCAYIKAPGVSHQNKFLKKGIFSIELFYNCAHDIRINKLHNRKQEDM